MMFYTKSQCVYAIILLMLSFVASTSASADNKPRYVGRSSCATATCHGGVVGLGPAWHSSSSVWESSDRHAQAGDVLLEDLSKRIVQALEPAAADSKAAYYMALQTRCVSCHAPEAASALPAEAAREFKSLDAALIAGVSCEACHGPASRWEKAHTLQGWNQPERFCATTGMLDTESPLSRADNCARCHVGSRTADGQVRDMNHDMIAAGHPALYFDMVRHHARLPKHWAEATDELAKVQRNQAPEAAEALRTRVLLAAIELSFERRTTKMPQPELSEFDCGSCHHDLRWNGPRQNHGSTGSALWHPWYTAGRELAVSRSELHLAQTDLDQLHRLLRQPLIERAASLVQDLKTDPRLHLNHLLTEGLPDNGADYCEAAAWTDQIEDARTAAHENEADQEQANKLFMLFRQRVLGFQKARPAPLEVLIPREWEQHELDSVRKELFLLLKPNPVAPVQR